MLAKAEIHCHIEGAAPPALVEAQARKYGADVSGIIRDGAYFWSDFTSFLAAYDLAASLFRTADDCALLAETYLASLAAEGAIYSEFFISIDHARGAGLDPADYVAGLAEGIGRARAACGIEARMIVVGLRHLGPEAVAATARWTAANRHGLVTGFGMAGDERAYHPRDFAAAFAIAREAGLGITVHAGELAGAESVRAALDHLRPARIGHGVRAIEDAALVGRIAAEGVVLEVCPASNIALKVFASYADHPLRRLDAAGCRVTLNSDDPPHFHTSLGNEYDIARTRFGYDEAALMRFTRTAIEAAFIDGETRARLLEKCAAAVIG
ncbi:MAG: adenosine deaminase [Alphaproteobacteria bacterium]|nr:MAG: adenosine deaminase [Alphaproteobacteria bacterium]